MSSMMLLLVALSATPVKVAATRINLVDGTASRADFYTEHLVDRLGEQGLAVTSPREMTAMLGVERQRQLLGCAETICVTEVANALGVDGIVLGDIARVGRTFQVNVKVIGAQSGKRLATFSASVNSEGELVATLAQAARALAVQLGQVVQPAAAGSRRWWWIPSLVAAGGIALASIELLQAENSRLQLSTGTFDSATAWSTLQVGQTARTIGFIGVGVASAGLAALVGLLLFGSPPTATPTVWLNPTSGGLSLTGVWP